MISITDLAHLSWIEFHVPRLGPLTVEALSGNFFDWVRNGLKRSAWSDGRAFIRDLLSTQARPGRDDPPHGEEAVASLDDEELSEAADLFLAATGVYFQPKYVSDGVGHRRKVRKRREGEEYDIAAAEGETGADRLLRVVRAWVEDQAEFHKKIIQQAEGASSIVRQYEKDMGLSRFWEQQKKLALLDPLPAAIRALESPNRKFIAEMLAPSKLLAESIGHHARPAGILAEIQAQDARLRELVGFKQGAALEALNLVNLYPNIGARLPVGLGIASDVSAALRGLMPDVGAAGFEPSLSRVLADQATFATSISRQFDLRIPATTLAAIGALYGANSLAEATRGQSLFPPGFQMAAAWGLETTTARGLVADLLHHYGEEAPDAPLFGHALESAAVVDAEELTEAEAVSFLQRVAGFILAAIQNERDVVARGGMIGVLILICTLLSGYVGLASLQVAEKSLVVAEQSLNSAQAQPTNSDLAAVIRESQATREAFEAERRERADDRHRIRYVHERAPLRTEPHAQGMLIRSVYPDQLLRVVDEQGEWLKVEVFDYQSDGVTRGWISRRRVRLNPPA